MRCVATAEVQAYKDENDELKDKLAAAEAVSDETGNAAALDALGKQLAEERKRGDRLQSRVRLLEAENECLQDAANVRHAIASCFYHSAFALFHTEAGVLVSLQSCKCAKDADALELDEIVLPQLTIPLMGFVPPKPVLFHHSGVAIVTVESTYGAGMAAREQTRAVSRTGSAAEPPHLTSAVVATPSTTTPYHTPKAINSHAALQSRPVNTGMAATKTSKTPARRQLLCSPLPTDEEDDAFHTPKQFAVPQEWRPSNLATAFAMTGIAVCDTTQPRAVKPKKAAHGVTREKARGLWVSPSCYRPLSMMFVVLTRAVVQVFGQSAVAPGPAARKEALQVKAQTRSGISGGPIRAQEPFGATL